MKNVQRIRRLTAAVVLIVASALFVATNQGFFDTTQPAQVPPASSTSSPALKVLGTLAVKGRAPKTGYSREQFGGVWADIDGTCDARDVILQRDLVDTKVNDKCQVTSGVLHDPYTGKTIDFTRGPSTSASVQIDHVVAISDAWQTGAQQLTPAERKAMYVDPLELLAVDGPANQQKSDGDAATWLPSNKAFRCQYVARQIAVKAKYRLWVTPAEKQAIQAVLSKCPGQTVPDGALGKQT